jgi:ABC-2 type transport system ATP-binding protein
MRGLLREQAAKGHAVLISSHLLAEVAQSVDDVVVIANGELRGEGTLEQVLGGDQDPTTEVRTRDHERLAQALERRGHGTAREGDTLLVASATPEQVGAIALEEQVALTGLGPRGRSLEAAFFALTEDQP